jgi:alkylation response protein AidB-like acyl-CoA dehydrogenase
MDGTDERVVEQARSLGPLIKEHAAAGEHERRLSPAVLAELDRSGLTRAFLPRALGGLELDPVTAVRVVEELARHDAAVGWLMMVANGGTWFAGRMPTETAEEMFRDPRDCLVATTFQPPTMAREVDGGFRLSGQRPFASFVHASRWLCVTGLVMDGDQPQMAHGMPRVIVAIMPARDAEVVDTWRGLGLRATDSNDVAVRDVFVPARFTCPLSPVYEPNAHYRGPLYRIPVLAAIVLSSIAPTALAIATAAVDEVRALCAKKVPMGSMVPLRERGATQATLGRAEAMLAAARALVYETMADTWQRTLAGETVDLARKGRILAAATHAAQTAAQVTDLMFSLGGSTSVFDDQPLQRLFRDAQVIRQHGFVGVGRYETAAQVALGLEPDLPLVHF